MIKKGYEKVKRSSPFFSAYLLALFINCLLDLWYYSDH